MADPIPSADAALLAAQARAGQAGVDAYKAAQAELGNQRQQALQQAMQEAALRGAPGGAMQSIQSTITGPYDQGIASMGARSADYQAEMGRRDRTLGDYNSVIQSSRSLIPGQVEMVVAPIRAQSEFNLRSQQIAGDRSVAEIQANTQLALAKMAAAVDAAKRKAAADAAKANELNQGELSALMTSGARDLIQQKLGGVSSAIGANESEIGQAFAQDFNTNAPKFAGAQQAQNAVRQQSFFDLLGAAYTGKAIQEDKSKPRTPSPTSGPIPSPFGSGRGTNVGNNMPNDPNTAAMRAAVEARMRGQQGGTLPSDRNGPPGAAPIAATPTTDYSAAEQQARDLAARVAAMRGQLTSKGFDLNTDLTRALTMRLLGGLSNQYAAHSSVNQAGQRVLMTPDQINQLDPYSYSAVMGAPDPIRGTDAFNRVVMGQAAPPGDYYDTGGVANPYSSEVMHNALAQSAQGLRDQGYQFDLPEAMNAMPKATSIHDFLAEQGAGQTNEDFYKMTQAQGTKAQTAGDKATLAEAQEKLRQAGLPAKPPAAVGDAVDAWNMYNDPGTRPAIDSAGSVLQQILAGWGSTKETQDAKGNPRTPSHNDLREALRLQGIPPDLAEYVLWMNQY